MRVEALQYFLAIAECGSYSQASRRLYISQQGLGKAVRALERELDVSLFEKTGRKLHLTDAGKRLVPLARKHVELDRMTRDAMREFSSSRSKSDIVLWAMPFASSVVFNLMKDDMESWGLRDVVLVECDLPEIVDSLHDPEGKCGLALVAVPLSEAQALMQDDGIDFVPLVASDLGVIGTSALLSPRRHSISAGEVAQLPVAAYSERVLDGLVRELFVKHPLQKELMHTTNLKMIEEVVEAGRAITFWDSFSAFLGAESDMRIFVPIDGSPTFVLGVGARKSGIHDEAEEYLRRLSECIMTVCAPYQASHPLPSVHHHHIPGR